MRTTQIKQQLHNYIDTVEDKKLKAIYTLLEEDIVQNSQLNDKQKIELDKRLDDYENGLTGVYTWEETISMARNSSQ